MSRAGAKKKLQVDAGFIEQIPLKPESVVAYEEELRERKLIMLYASCRTAAWKGRFPLFMSPDALGAAIADNVLNQIMQQMIIAQSKIIVPMPQIERIGA